VCRFKLHVQVMDNTGSTSFILFDRNVSSYVGRSVQDLIDTQGQVEQKLFLYRMVYEFYSFEVFVLT
jgi:hypothetical protein